MCSGISTLKTTHVTSAKLGKTQENPIQSPYLEMTSIPLYCRPEWADMMRIIYLQQLSVDSEGEKI